MLYYWTHRGISTPIYYGVIEKEDHLEAELKLPGIKKDEIEIKYIADRNIINVFVKDKIDEDVYLNRQIAPEGIKASLDLGILLIKAPIKNTDKKIEIE